MVNKEKKKINLPYIWIALLLCATWFIKPNKINEGDLIMREATLKKAPQYIGGSRGTGGFYRLWTNEHKASYMVETPGSNTAGDGIIKNMQPGDSLQVKINESRISEEENKSKDIPVYYLIQNHHLLFDINDYNRENTYGDRRWNYIALIISFLLFGRGFNLLSDRTAIIFLVSAFVVIITLKILGLW